MKYGLLDDELKLMRDVFELSPNIKKVVLYGSRAKGTNRPFSDVDITLMGDHITDDDLTNVMYRLSESSLPYFCDVSIFNNLSNDALVSHIKRVGQTIYEA